MEEISMWHWQEDVEEGEAEVAEGEDVEEGDGKMIHRHLEAISHELKRMREWEDARIRHETVPCKNFITNPRLIRI